MKHDFTNYTTKSLTRLATTLHIASPKRNCVSTKLLKAVEAELRRRDLQLLNEQYQDRLEKSIEEIDQQKNEAEQWEKCGGSIEDDIERARRYGKGDQKFAPEVDEWIERFPE